MLIKLGVDIRRLKRPMRRVLNIVEAGYLRVTREEAVITSTYEGNHSPSSLHYDNSAVDFRKPADNHKGDVLTVIKKALGDDYDVVWSSTCLHVEHDPK